MIQPSGVQVLPLHVQSPPSACIAGPLVLPGFAAKAGKLRNKAIITLPTIFPRFFLNVVRLFIGVSGKFTLFNRRRSVTTLP